MASDPAYVAAFKTYMANPSPMEIGQIEKEFYGESTRAICILQAAMVELALETALKSTLRPDISNTLIGNLFGFDSPAGTFSAKIDLAYALGIFGQETNHDLGLIRTMRNGFAHSRAPATFAINVVTEMCNHLQIPDRSIAIVPSGYWNHTDDLDLAAGLANQSAKKRFVSACHTIAAYLLEFANRSPRAPLDRSELP